MARIGHTARAGCHGSVSGSMSVTGASTPATSRRTDGKSTPAQIPSRSDTCCASHRSTPRVGTATTSVANGSGSGSASRSARPATNRSDRSARCRWRLMVGQSLDTTSDSHGVPPCGRGPAAVLRTFAGPEHAGLALLGEAQTGAAPSARSGTGYCGCACRRTVQRGGEGAAGRRGCSGAERCSGAEGCSGAERSAVRCPAWRCGRPDGAGESDSVSRLAVRPAGWRREVRSGRTLGGLRPVRPERTLLPRWPCRA